MQADLAAGDTNMTIEAASIVTFCYIFTHADGSRVSIAITRVCLCVCDPVSACVSRR